MTLGAAGVVVAVLSAFAYGDSRKVRDLDRIQGLWQATSAMSEGKVVDAKTVKGMYIAFAGNRMIPFGEDDLPDAIYSFQLHGKAKTKQISLTLKVKGKPITAEGIYSLEGDTLKLCWDQDGGPRPTTFNSPPNGRVFSVVLKRSKPKEK